MGQWQQTLYMWWANSEIKTLVVWLVGGLLLRILVAIGLPPGFDEAYYYLYTRNLDWSYFDHPVMVALTTGFGPWLTGVVSPFTIRLGPLLLYTGSLLLLYQTARMLFSRQAGVLTVAIASLIPIFWLGFGVLTLPDSPLIFFWSATLYLAVKEFFGSAFLYKPTYRLALIGLLVGLACLSKYHGLALGFGLVGFCLTSPRHRSALVSPWMVLAIALFLLALSPIVIWNAQHDWISLRYQSGRAVPDRGYSLLELLGTFLIGVAYLFPTFGFPLWWVIGQRVATQVGKWRQLGPSVQPLTPEQTQQLATRLMLWLSLPLIVFFTGLGGYRPILPTWAMPGFWGTTVFLGAQAAIWQRRSPKAVRRWLWGSGLVIVTLLVVALLHVNLGTLQQNSRSAWLGGLVPAEADASVQLLGLQPMRQGFEQSPALRAALARADFVFTSEIFMAGRVGMAIAPLSSLPVTSFTDDVRGIAFWSTAEQWVGQTGLYLTDSRLATVDPYRSYFESIQKVGDIPIVRGGKVVETVQVYECQNLLKPYPRPYGR